MKLNQMKAFTELMITGSVSEAARNLNRTQPSVSSLIASLEDDLGMKLFERRNSRLHPVREAQYLFEECSELLRRMDTIGQNMRRIRALESGELKVASMPGPSVFLIPELVAQHGLDHHDVKATMVSRSSDAVYQLIAAQQYDLGIADYDPDAPAETALIASQVFRFKCLCAVPADDKLAKKSVVTAKDLNRRKLATLYNEHPIYGRVEKAFSARDSEMNVRFMTQNFIPLLTFVEKGIACAIVDPVAAESYRLYKRNDLGIVFRPFEPVVYFEIAVITPVHRPASLIATYFKEMVMSEFTRISGANSAKRK